MTDQIIRVLRLMKQRFEIEETEHGDGTTLLIERRLARAGLPAVVL